MTPSLLLVEDDEMEAELAGFALRRASVPHRVLRARDGAEALALAGSGQPIDLVLLDLHLPGVQGTALLDALRNIESLRHVPVVMYSSSREPPDIAACYSRGANSYLHKTSDTRSFAEDMSLVLFYWLRLNALPGESPEHRSERHASAGVEKEQARSRPFTFPFRERKDSELAHVHALSRHAAAIVVDADPELRRIASETLREVAGVVPVLDASGRREARERLSQAHIARGHSPWSCVRLVLIDLDANPEDGLAIARDVRADVDHRLPLVVFTANDSADFVDRCYALHVNSVVRKPDAASVRDTVRLIGHYWLRLNETIPAPDILPV